MHNRWAVPGGCPAQFFGALPRQVDRAVPEGQAELTRSADRRRIEAQYAGERLDPRARDGIGLAAVHVRRAGEVMDAGMDALADMHAIELDRCRRIDQQDTRLVDHARARAAGVLDVDVAPRQRAARLLHLEA